MKINAQVHHACLSHWQIFFSLQELTVTMHKPLHKILFAKLRTGDA